MGPMRQEDSPNYSSRDEENDGSEEEGESLHEVQCGWVKGVEEATANKETQAFHTGNRRKQDTWEKNKTMVTECT